MKLFEDLNLSDFKSGKIEKKALKEKLFKLRLLNYPMKIQIKSQKKQN